MTVLSDIEAELNIPRFVQDFMIGMQYRCRTCVLDKGADTITVHVKWPK